MKPRTLLFVSLLAIMILLISGCDDDSSKYVYATYDVDYSIQSKLTKPDDFKDELQRIVDLYASGTELKKVIYSLDYNNIGNIYCEFGKNYEDNYKNGRTTLVSINMDVSTKKINSIIYNDGHSKRVTTSEQGVKNPSVETDDILAWLREQEYYSDVELDKIKIVYDNQGIRVIGYHGEEQQINVEYMK